MSKGDFSWNKEADEYRCPQGKVLRREHRFFKRLRTHITKVGTIIYRSSQQECVVCTIKTKCCANTPMCKISRSIHETSRELARAIAKTPAYWQSRLDLRKVKVLFAHLKHIMKLDRLRLRGLSGARDEFLLAATAQNLRRMAKRLTPMAGRVEMAPALAANWSRPINNRLTTAKIPSYLWLVASVA